MAYVSKADKEKIVKAVKAVLPKDWKATFAVRNYSTIVCTIRSAPVDLEKIFPDTWKPEGKPLTNVDVNHYHIHRNCKDKKIADILQKIVDALNTDNFDNSDPMTDYFCVGHYVDLRFGEWNKPFINTLAK